MSPNIQSVLPAGAFASVPRQIGSRFVTRDVPATILCFPSCIPYVSIRRGLTSDALRTYVAVYYPIFASVRFSSGSVQLSFRWLYDSPISVHVLRETNGSRWDIFKCWGSKLIAHVSGSGYGDALIRATSLGLADHEPALTYEATLATLDEIRNENLAQIELGERSIEQ